MKKMLFCTLILGFTLITNAQERLFKPFKADLAVGYAMPSGSGTKAGVLFAVEPKYGINDNLSLGLRMEVAVTARATVDQNGETMTGDVKASGSYLATADYYFNTNKFRPFAGAGAGIYRVATASLESEEGEVVTGTKFGFAPRVGFEYGHFRTAVEYNVAGKTGPVNNNYLGIKLGFFIGGGRLQ